MLVPYFCVWFVRFQFILLVTKSFDVAADHRKNNWKVFTLSSQKFDVRGRRRGRAHGRRKKWKTEKTKAETTTGEWITDE